MIDFECHADHKFLYLCFLASQLYCNFQAYNDNQINYYQCFYLDDFSYTLKSTLSQYLESHQIPYHLSLPLISYMGVRLTLRFIILHYQITDCCHHRHFSDHSL